MSQPQGQPLNQQQQGPSSSTSSVSIPQTAAAGGLTITKPPQTATSYFKIATSNTITIAWNLTSLYVTPTSLTCSAVCENGNTYPVGPTNGLIPGTQSSVLWDLWAYQTAHPNVPLTPGKCVLHVFDERGEGAPIQPGLFQENSALQFALYSPQPYTPLDSWQCATCNGAWSDFATHPAFVSLTVTIVVMVLSGYSLLRQAMR